MKGRLFLTVVAFAAAGCAATADGRAAGEGGRPVVRLDAPGTLDRSDTDYLLTRDLTADGTAFVIEGSRITLDLGGHRVVYGARKEKEAYGVSVPGFHRRDIRIVGGTLVQAPESPCRGDANARGCNPVFIPQDAADVEIARMTVDYHAPSTAGLYMHWTRGASIHDNRFVDRGTQLENRHQGAAVVENTRGSDLSARENVIERARHLGIRTGEKADIRNNDIAVESIATNSTAIAVKSGRIVGNRIVGRGVHPIGIWPGNDTQVEGNYVDVRSTRPGTEYGSTGAACLRMTWGNDGVEVVDNLFVLEAAESGEGGEEGGGWGRALWVGLPHEGEKALFERNLIVANNRRGEAKAAAIAVVCNNASSGLVFRENTVISNWGPVLLADDYGHADGFPRFIDNVFVRQDDFPSYRTIRSEYPGRPSTGVFIGNRYLNGASESDVDLEWGGEGKKELRFGRSLLLSVRDAADRPVPDAEVEVSGDEGDVLLRGKTDARGELRGEVIDRVLTNRGGARKASADAGSAAPLSRRSELIVTARKGELAQRRLLPVGGGEERIGLVLAPKEVGR